MVARAIVSVIAGVVVAVVVILAVELLGRFVVPVADAPRLEDVAAMRDYLARMPATAYFFVLAAYAAGCYAGGRVAARVAGRPGSRSVWVVGALMLATTTANLLMITHPTWFVVAAIVIIILATGLAAFRPLASRAPSGA